ncbi:MAG: glycosyltransferase family 4 protein [Flavobacteriaceae bacterium]|nr:glycosyltransferase family 4 protein [Flavobacteriaceae bacterium]
MMQIIQLFLEDNYQISFASTSTKSEYSAQLEELGVKETSIELNAPSFDHFISELNPSIVLFDRYITEEQFGWRVAEQCPNALRILDTEDLHFLRKARQEALKSGIKDDKVSLLTDTAKRELASIFRSDLSLIISEVEIDLLYTQFKLPKEILYYLPFLEEAISEEEKKELPTFEERQHFMTIGNFQHAPNLDAVLYLKQEIWPEIRKRLPKAELHIYGAYAPKRAVELHNEKEGFYIKGWANDADEVMRNARVCLAPLRFGAGLKGKLIDAMRNGTPSVTTKIGAEGMHGTMPFSGVVKDTVAEFIDASIQLYTEEKAWIRGQFNGFQIIENRFQKAAFSEAFKQKLNELQQNLELHRQQNFMGRILEHQSMRATKFMSKWIEEKNKSS